MPTFGVLVSQHTSLVRFNWASPNCADTLEVNFHIAGTAEAGFKHAGTEVKGTGVVSKATSADSKTAVAEMGSSKTAVDILELAVAVLDAEMVSSRAAVEKEVADVESSSEDDDLIIIANEDVKDW
ncbi:hypothetical protein E3N88_10640 [Mikania micrantha]|uniref:Uncharacterized protein n=1 Tax=Mikania micrantha TaxID=192012 RepID=A0A5N6PCB1_9ASTR|nr:hypothetical protein E3N88_10640 [Mikania micrantha]